MPLLNILVILLLIIGLIGVIVPVIPGIPLIFLGALLYDYASGWTALGWGGLGVLFVLMLVGAVGEWWVSQASARRGGASWISLLVGVILSLIGTFMFPPFGFLIGAILGVVGTELLISKDARHALRAGGGWFMGWVLSFILQAVIAVIMIAIIVWQMF